MATVYPIEHRPQNGGYIVFTWTLSEGDEAAPVELGQFPDRSVQIGGDFGSGGQVSIEGSNNVAGLGYSPFTDPQGNPLSAVSSARFEQLSEIAAFFRPRVAAGTGVSVVVSLLVRTKGT